MPVNLARLITNTATADIDFGAAGTLHVTYYPARITTELLLNYAAMQDPDGMGATTTERATTVMSSAERELPHLLAGWDLTETAEDGTEQPLPLDAAHIAALGVQVQWAILAGLLRGQQQAAAGEAVAPEASASA